MKLAIIICILSLLSASCSKTINCTDPYINLAFIGIPRTDIDTITVRKYPRDSNFLQPIDSFNLIENLNAITIPNQTGDTIRIHPNVPELAIENGFDWQIYIPSTGHTFLLTKIVTQSKSEKCGTFSTSCYCENKVVSIKLNNVDIMTTSFRPNTIFIR